VAILLMIVSYLMQPNEKWYNYKQSNLDKKKCKSRGGTYHRADTVFPALIWGNNSDCDTYSEYDKWQNKQNTTGFCCKKNRPVCNGRTCYDPKKKQITDTRNNRIVHDDEAPVYDNEPVEKTDIIQLE
jgi:hypothetical protein